MGWKDTIKDENLKSWKDTIVESAPEMSTAESLGRGALQSASLGFADEGSGLVDAILSKTGTLLTGGAPNPYADQPITEVYRSGRDEERQANSEASQNPAYLAGGVAGSLATAPGATGIKALAGLGALSGLGGSEESNVGGMAADTAKGGAMGLLSGLLAKGANKVLTPVAKPAKPAWDFPIRNRAGEAVKREAITSASSKIKIPESIKELASGPVATVAGVATGGMSLPVTEAIRTGAAEKGINATVDATTAILNKTANSKFAPILKKASEGGARAVAVTHFMLSSSNPEYQEETKD